LSLLLRWGAQVGIGTPTALFVVMRTYSGGLYWDKVMRLDWDTPADGFKSAAPTYATEAVQSLAPMRIAILGTVLFVSYTVTATNTVVLSSVPISANSAILGNSILASSPLGAEVSMTNLIGPTPPSGINFTGHITAMAASPQGRALYVADQLSLRELFLDDGQFVVRGLAGNNYVDAPSVDGPLLSGAPATLQGIDTPTALVVSHSGTTLTVLQLVMNGALASVRILRQTGAHVWQTCPDTTSVCNNTLRACVCPAGMWYNIIASTCNLCSVCGVAEVTMAPCTSVTDTVCATGCGFRSTAVDGYDSMYRFLPPAYTNWTGRVVGPMVALSSAELAVAAVPYPSLSAPGGGTISTRHLNSGAVLEEVDLNLLYAYVHPLRHSAWLTSSHTPTRARPHTHTAAPARKSL